MNTANIVKNAVLTGVALAFAATLPLIARAA